MSSSKIYWGGECPTTPNTVGGEGNVCHSRIIYLHDSQTLLSRYRLSDTTDVIPWLITKIILMDMREFIFIIDDVFSNNLEMFGCEVLSSCSL